MKVIRFFRKSKVLISALIFLTLSLSLVSYIGKSDDFELVKNLDIFHTLYRELNIYYVDEVHPGNLIRVAMDAMLKSLDPYTVYIPESQIEDYRFLTTGQYGGIGAAVTSIGGKLVITEPFQDSPADKAGIKAGDIILEVDGKSTAGKTTDDVGKVLKGQPNSTIKLRVERQGVAAPLEFTLIRQKIDMKSVPYSGMLNETVGYIVLKDFTENSGNDVKEALVNLKDKNNVKALVLDLRGNPGGLLIEAVNIVNLFVNKGQDVVSMKGKVNQWNKTFKAMNPPIDLEIPVVVLINSMSASASEIVSGALQDLDRAVIIGQRSYGKGLVQTTRPLSYNAQFKVTTAKYYIPSGRCIQALDYSNRRDDGSVGKVPDSLISEFTTMRGRKVYDGGGVLPDIQVTARNYSKIAIQLITEGIIFNYATQYALDHKSIAPAKQFTIDDEAYKKFVSYVETHKFTYRTQSEEQLKKLIETAQKEKYFEDAKAEFQRLESKLANNCSRDLDLFKDEIKLLLEIEIASRYYYESGRVETSLSNDADIKKAIEILTEPNLITYNKVLSINFIPGK